jgi:hypothetical protein
MSRHRESTSTTTSINTQPSENTEEEVTPQSEEKLLVSDILQHLSKNQQSGAKALLAVIDKNMRLDWNSKGELTVEGNPVVHSHISDLLKDALVQYKHFQPVGIEEFYSNLTNIPLTLIRNPQRRSLLQRGRGIAGVIQPSIESPPPPPGLPSNKRERILLKPAKQLKKGIRKNTWLDLWEKI